ncbi:MAG: enoyl-CoA hydratase-related protein [Thermomicrobiales bacterium]
MSDQPPILLDVADGIATVTLNRPHALNAISHALAEALRATCTMLRNRNEVRVVIVTGAGERAFCAGADLRERGGMTAHERNAHRAAIEAAAEDLAALPMPTIAAVRGYALAGGTELAIACDLRVAGTDATFGVPEVKIGIFPGAGGVLRLPPLIGLGNARDLLFTGRHISAEEAAHMGLVNSLVAPEDVLPAARNMAVQIAVNAPLALRAVKDALRASSGLPASEARHEVNQRRVALDDTADYEEGLRAFAEKRPPQFTGQ